MGMLLLRVVACIGIIVGAIALGSTVTSNGADAVLVPPCPAGWSCGDIGGPIPAGSQSFANGIWQLQGGGDDIWSIADTFHFVWQQMAGDGTVGAQVVTQTATNLWAKAGVMMRASTDPGSSYYAAYFTPGHGVRVQYRPSTGVDAMDAGPGVALQVPGYVEVTRTGTTFTASTSTDGTNWLPVPGSTRTLPTLSGGLLSGMAITSHQRYQMGTATFQLLPQGGSPQGGSQGGGGTNSGGSSGAVTDCGTALCVNGSSWSMYGATVYNPGLQPYLSGIKDPAGTIALAEQAHLNTIRLTDFLDVRGSVSSAPYDETRWRYIDAMIAAAGAAGLHVDLGLADYRAILANNCVNPYSADWTPFIDAVANRVNTVTGVVYKNDPTIAFVSVAGEPLPVGTHQYTASATGQPCSLTYTTTMLTSFYAATTSAWKQQGGTVLINSGGLGYLNESNSGIDWKSIFALPTNDVCDIKTYGGMQAWASVAASYCQSIGKPIVVEEFGWQQSAGDAQRAQLFDTMVAQLRAMGVAGLAFWNLGYQLAPTSYEVNPSTPLAFAAVTQNAP